MGRKKNKSSKNKGTKTSNKSTQNGAKPKTDPQPGTSQSLDVDAGASRDFDPADDISTASSLPCTSQSESRQSVTHSQDYSYSEAKEPTAKGRVSKREEFERSRSFSSRSSNEGDNQAINQTESFSVNASLDVPLTDPQDSSASAELTEEALSMHTQLLEAAPSTSARPSSGLSAPLESISGKRASMLSHEDCESGVGTFSVQSESTHRDDTFADDEQEVHPLIHADLDLDIQATEMHQMAENMMHLRDQSRSASNVSDLHMDRLNSKQNSSISLDNPSEGQTEEKYEKEPEDAPDHPNDSDNQNHLDNSDCPDNKDSTEKVDASSPRSEAAEGYVRVEGKPPSGNFQRQGSSSASAELSRTNQFSHTGSGTSDLIMSGTMPQGLTSSDLTSSKTGTFSTMSASKTSTGMAYHSTYHSTNSDFALTTSHSILEEGSLSKFSDIASRDGSDIVDGNIDQEQSDRHEIQSSTSAISTVGDLPDILSPSGGNMVVRASLDEAEDVDRRMSLDYDLGSSIESMGITHAIKFSNLGVSLFDELQMARDGDSSVRSTPRKSRSNTASSVLSDKAMNETLGSVSEQAEVSYQPLQNTNTTTMSLGSTAKTDAQLLLQSQNEEEPRTPSPKDSDNRDRTPSPIIASSKHSSQVRQREERSHSNVSFAENVDNNSENSGRYSTKSPSHDSNEHAGELTEGRQGYNAFPEHTQSAPALLELQRLQEEEEEEQRRLYMELYEEQLNERSNTRDDLMDDIRVVQLEENSESESQRSSTPQESDGAKEVAYLQHAEDVEKYRMEKYKDLAQNPPVPLQKISNVYVDERGDIVNAELNVADAESSFNRSLVVEQSVDEILENREQVASAVASLNHEIQNLQEENKKLYGEMTGYRSSSKQFKQKADNYEGYLKAQREQMKKLEIKLAEINSQRQNVRNVSAMTEHVLMLNTCVQVEQLKYDAHTQVFIPSINRACQISPSTQHVTNASSQTQATTGDLQRTGEGQIKVDEKRASGEGTEKKKNLAKASAMLDKILRQMNNIAGNIDELNESTASDILGDDKEPETVDKWRHLSMTPISTEPQVLRIQRSLASAVMEHDILNTKISKSTRESETKIDELDNQLQTANKNLQKSRDECNDWHCKYEGDRAQLEILRERTQALEKELLMNKLEKDRLQDEIKVRTEVMESGDLVSREAMDKVRQERNDSEVKTGKLELENKKMHEELVEVQQARGEDLEKLNTQESKVSALQADKAVLEVELASIREEYKHLQTGLSAVENLFLERPVEKTDETYAEFHHTAEKRIEELKRHVFESKKPKREGTESHQGTVGGSDVLASSTRSTNSVKSAHSNHSIHSNESATSTAANSVHNEILKQSELILDILRENGDIEDEEVLREVQLVNWQDVKNSITNHLKGETEEKVNAAVSEASGDKDSIPEENNPHTERNNGETDDIESQLSDSDVPLTTEDLEIKSQLSDLASALSSDLGVKVNLVVETPRQTIEPPKNESTPVLDKKQKQKIELEKMDRDYEELRKKRLALLVQAYTGKPDYKPTSSFNQSHSSLPYKPLDSGSYRQAESLPVNGQSDALAEYDKETAALKQRIEAFRQEIKKDRPSTDTYSSNTFNNASGSYKPTSSSNYDPAPKSPVLKQSKDELDSLLSKGSRVPRVCVGGSSSSLKSPRSNLTIRSALSSQSTNPYSYRLKRQIYPHKLDYVPVDRFYEEAERSESERYYGNERDPRDYGDDPESYRNGYDDYDQNGGEYGQNEAFVQNGDYGRNGDFEQNGDYYDDAGYDQDEYREERRYEDGGGEEMYEDEQEREQYYNQQKRMNSKAIQKMRSKLIQNKKRIEMEQAKRMEKQRSKYVGYKDERPSDQFISRDDPVGKQDMRKSNTYKSPYSTSTSTYPASTDKDDKWAVKPDYAKDKWAIKGYDTKEHNYRMSLHREYPCEVDLLSGSNAPRLQGYDPDKFDSSYFKMDTVAPTPETRDQHLVSKYIKQEESSKKVSRDTSPTPTYKVELKSQINTVPTVTSTSYSSYSSRYNEEQAKVTDSKTYLSENKENYEHLDASNVTFGRGRDYNRSSEASNLTSFMELPSRLLGDNTTKIHNRLDTLGKDLPSDAKYDMERKTDIYSSYRSPFDKYDVRTENNVSTITPKDTQPSKPGFDKKTNSYSTTKGSSKAVLDDKPNVRSHHASSAATKSRNVPDSHSRKHEKPKDHDHRYKQDEPERRSKSQKEKSNERDQTNVLKSTSAARSRESSPSRYTQPSDKHPSDGYKKPSDGYKQSSDGYKQPSDGYKQPSDGYKQPSDGYKQPRDGYKQASDGYKPTSDGYKHYRPQNKGEHTETKYRPSADRKHDDQPKSYAHKKRDISPARHKDVSTDHKPSDPPPKYDTKYDYRYSSPSKTVTSTNTHSDKYSRDYSDKHGKEYEKYAKSHDKHTKGQDRYARDHDTHLKEDKRYAKDQVKGHDKYALDSKPSYSQRYTGSGMVTGEYGQTQPKDLETATSKYSSPTRSTDVERFSKTAPSVPVTADKHNSKANDYSTKYSHGDPNPQYVDVEKRSAMLKGVDSKYKIPSSAYQPSEPLNVKDRQTEKPSRYEYKPEPSSSKTVLNSRNLESLDRENAEKMRREAAEDKLMKSRILTTQKSLPDDVSSVAGSSDADFVVVASGDIMRRKSKAAKRLDKARNAELQMKSFDVPYERFEDDYYRRTEADRLPEVDEESEDNDAMRDSDYWGEPKRHFGLKPSSKESKSWAESKPRADTAAVDVNYSKSTSALLEDDINSSVVDQKWYRDAKEVLAKSYPNRDQRTKSSEQVIADAKEKLRHYADSMSNACDHEVNKPTFDKEDFEKGKANVNVELRSTSDYAYDSGKEKQLSSSVRSEKETDSDKAQRRVHWGTPHMQVKMITPEGEQSRSPSAANQSNTGTMLESEKYLTPTTGFRSNSAHSKENISNTVKEMKAASGIYEVPKLSRSVDEKPSEIEKVDVVKEKKEEQEGMYLPRNMEERQQIVDTIIDKYTKEYDQDSFQNVTEKDFVVSESESVVEFTPKSSSSKTSSRIPLPSPTRESTLSVPNSSSTPIKSSQNIHLSAEKRSPSAIPVRSPSKESKLDAFPFDLSPIKESYRSIHDQTKSPDEYNYKSRDRSADSLPSHDLTLEHSVSKRNDSTERNNSSSDQKQTDALRFSDGEQKTHIPVRRGSDVEDRYRRDRSHSRDSASDSLSNSRMSSKEIDDIISRYTGKSPQSVAET